MSAPSNPTRPTRKTLSSVALSLLPSPAGRDVRMASLLLCLLSSFPNNASAFTNPSDQARANIPGFLTSSSQYFLASTQASVSSSPSSMPSLPFAKRRLKSHHFAFPPRPDSQSTDTDRSSSNFSSSNNPFFAQESTEQQQEMQEEYYGNGYIGGYYMDNDDNNGGYGTGASYSNNDNEGYDSETSYDNSQQEMQYQNEGTFFEQQQSGQDTQDQTTFNANQNAASTASEAMDTSTRSQQQPISSVDARVLESILMEGKLDLSTEEEVKKLLKGPRMKEEEEGGKKASGEEKDGKGGDGEYSSKFVSAISDNTFWNSLKAKATSVLESVSIYIENRIERDAQLLASVGLFAWDRVQRDVARALPAAGRQVKRALLASNSSYAEKLLNVTEKVGVLALPAERSMTSGEMDDESLYDELTTPADEIKQVTTAILDILSGKELPASSSYSANARRGSSSLKSLAPAGTSKLAERQRRAYQARKQTVLQREKEGVDSKLWRGIGEISDATYELRREMQMGEGREAGYRSKGVRKALAEGAGLLLEAGRQGQKWLAESASRNEQRRLGGESTEDVQVQEVAAMGNNLNFVDVEVSIDEDEIIEEVIEETNLEYAPDGLLSPQSFMEEKSRLVTSLEACLSKPGQTWLTKEVVAQATQSGINLDGDILREVITTMVCARDELKKDIDEIEQYERVSLKMDFVQQEYRRMKEMVDSVSALAVLAAGEAAACLLQEELEGFVLSDSLDDILNTEAERVEQLLADMVAAREEEILMRQKVKEEAAKEFQRSDPVAATVIVEEPTTWTKPVENNRYQNVPVADVEVVSSYSQNDPYYTSEQADDYFDVSNEQSTEQEAYTQYARSTVEVVSDDEYSEYEERFKSVQSSDAEEEGADLGQENDNPVGKFVLRVIDAIFFVGEKFFLVGLPAIITGGSNISSRYAQAQNRGEGSSGWKLVKNLKTKKSQY